MKPVRGFVLLVSGLIACSDGPTAPQTTPLAPQILSPTFEVGPESVTIRMTANMPVYWRVEYGETPNYGRKTDEVGPIQELNEIIHGLVPLRTYYYKVWARVGEARAGLSDEFRTPDYEPCDVRNTTERRVPVTVTYSPNQPFEPNTVVILDNLELLGCSGSLVNQPGDQMISQDNGRTYTRTFQLPVNHPNGSRPHSFRAMRVLYRFGPHFGGWAEPPDLRVNGVVPTARSDSLPPREICAPDVGCAPGVRWYFSVDSTGTIRP